MDQKLAALFLNVFHDTHTLPEDYPYIIVVGIVKDIISRFNVITTTAKTLGVSCLVSRRSLVNLLLLLDYGS